MSSEDERWKHLITDFPIDFTFKSKVSGIFPLAMDEFEKLSEGDWSLGNYEIVVSVSDDKSYAVISFLPDPAYTVNGIPFEIADRGMYKYGMGVNYVYRLADLTLVNTTYMR